MSLRVTVMRGGGYLAVRQALGLVIGLGGVLILTRVIGIEAYGVYAACIGLFGYAQTLSLCGINVFLVRSANEEHPRIYDQAFTLSLALSLGAAAVAFALTPLLTAATGLQELRTVWRACALLLPIGVASQVALARIERALNFRTVALTELAGQLLLYAVAIPMAVQGAGVWAPTAGFAAFQLFTCAAYFIRGRFFPRIVWVPAEVRRIMRYGLGYSSSIWVWQLRTLVNPLIVGHLAGASAVGYVALAIRIADALSFVKNATWRLSLAALARVRDNRERMSRAVGDGMKIQVVALGPLLLVFAWTGEFILVPLSGEHWRDVLRVFPLIAVGYLGNALFNLHSSALYVLNRNWDVTAFHIVHVAIFSGASLFLVPRLGYVGYGWAELVALVSYVVVSRLFSEAVGGGCPRIAVAWAAAFGVALVGYPHWLFVLALIPVAFLRATWKEAGQLAVSVRRMGREA